MKVTVLEVMCGVSYDNGFRYSVRKSRGFSENTYTSERREPDNDIYTHFVGRRSTNEVQNKSRFLLGKAGCISQIQLWQVDREVVEKPRKKYKSNSVRSYAIVWGLRIEHFSVDDRSSLT